MTELSVPESVDLAELEHLALRVARACGRLITGERPRDLGVAATKSSLTDVVTVMDQRSEQLAREKLLTERGSDGFYGEEDGRVVSASGITWVVDPIDGTVNYLYDIPSYCVSVAAVVGDPATPGAWRTVAAAVVEPVTGEAWVAHEGGGARLLTMRGDRTLSIPSQDELSLALVGTGFAYEADVRERQARVLTGVLPKVRDIRRRGSAALDLCNVADGRLDAYYEHGLHSWDFAGAGLVVTEAGGELRGLGDAAIADPYTLAGPKALTDQLDALLLEIKAD